MMAEISGFLRQVKSHNARRWTPSGSNADPVIECFVKIIILKNINLSKFSATHA
jgi:hypothetical protein